MTDEQNTTDKETIAKKVSAMHDRKAEATGRAEYDLGIPPTAGMYFKTRVLAQSTNRYNITRKMDTATIANIESYELTRIPHFWSCNDTVNFKKTLPTGVANPAYLPTLIAAYLEKYNPATAKISTLMDFIIQANYHAPCDTGMYLIPVFGRLEVTMKNSVMTLTSPNQQIAVAPGSAICFNRLLVRRSGLVDGSTRLANQILHAIHDLAYKANGNLPQDAAVPTTASLARKAMTAYYALLEERLDTKYGRYLAEAANELYNEFLEDANFYQKTRVKALFGQLLRKTGSNLLADYAGPVMPVTDNVLEQVYKAWKMTEMPDPNWLMVYMLSTRYTPEKPFSMFPFSRAIGSSNTFTMTIAPYTKPWSPTSEFQNGVAGFGVSYKPRNWIKMFSKAPILSTIAITAKSGITDNIDHTKLVKGVTQPDRDVSPQLMAAQTRTLAASDVKDLDMTEYGLPVAELISDSGQIARMRSACTDPRPCLINLGPGSSHLKVLALNSLNIQLQVEPLYNRYEIFEGIKDNEVKGKFPKQAVINSLRSGYRLKAQGDIGVRAMYLSDLFGATGN